MGVIELQSCNISSDTRVYITEKVNLTMKTTEVYGNSVRFERGLELIKEGKVFLSRENPYRAIVKGKKVNYPVNIAAQTCPCEDHRRHPVLLCKHIQEATTARKIQIGEIVIPYEVKN